MKITKLLLALCVPIVVATHVGIVAAQEWPTRPVRVVVPGSPGVTSDLVGRYVSERLTRKLGQSFYVQNIPGAGGSIAYRTAARFPADGYTVMMGTSGGLVVNKFIYKSLPYDPVTQFVPVAMIANTGGFVVTVDSKLPIRSIQDLVAIEKAKPGSISYAVEASSALTGVIGEMLNKKAGMAMVAIPYKEATMAVNDTVNGRTQVMISSMGVVHSAAEAGQLRRIAVVGKKRFPTLQDVPALAETWPGFEFPGYIMMIAPVGTPAQIVQRLNTAVQEVLQDPETVQYIKSLNFVIDGAGTPSGLVDVLRTEHVEAEKIFKGLGYVPSH
jgi:tripartite-type tricarboxylate transporter receptor subunit TctC